MAAEDSQGAKRRNEGVWQEHGRLFSAKRFEEWVELWDPEGRFVVMYPVEGMPATIEGRDALLANFGGLAGAVGEIRVSTTEFHQTTDPDVAFVEYAMHMDLPDGGAYDNRMAGRLTFRDGRLLEIREYYNYPNYERFLRDIGAL
ncbi:MAG: hypothetical protein AVDCRST_MAG12-9 [uncultured Rubrobacteraceae bacterium]|uniref:SnoaL-like domain-containing protein n=1 Tax=uncultured Rubrobacteraceae bacterium TaxID=349277 RepID=A0A6J4RE88_9ACTN|nr:MAG: hypothetical protein AVDCRST_MAG12-9 [uncultured Rubrobacteraceae bacterium]